MTAGTYPSPSPELVLEHPGVRLPSFLRRAGRAAVRGVVSGVILGLALGWLAYGPPV